MSALQKLIEQLYEQAKRGDWAAVLAEWEAEPIVARFCSLYQKASSGWTFLHQAAYWENETACRVLIRFGASARTLTLEEMSAVDVAKRKGPSLLAALLQRSRIEERSLWTPPSDPQLLPSSCFWSEAQERRATALMLVGYAGGVVRIPDGARYYVDSFERPLVGWHGTFDPPSEMDNESLVGTR